MAVLSVLPVQHACELVCFTRRSFLTLINSCSNVRLNGPSIDAPCVRMLNADVARSRTGPFARRRFRVTPLCAELQLELEGPSEEELDVEESWRINSDLTKAKRQHKHGAG